MYLSWAVLYEGASDQAYLDVLIPRVLEDVVSAHGIRNVTIPANPAIQITRGTIDNVAHEICLSKDAFELLFIHSDVGGRGLQSSLDERSTSFCTAAAALCAWPLDRCITITPLHETEAWILVDHVAVCGALGYRGNPTNVGLPISAQQAELLVDPKATMNAAIDAVRGRRARPDVLQLYPAIAQRQQLTMLRYARSFQGFERKIMRCLQNLRCIEL